MDRAGEDAAGEPTEPEVIARAYYRTIDDGDYEGLASLLAPEFVHDRPDLTLEGRERFVEFMREERPQTDTSHPIDGIYVPVSADGSAGSTEVVIRGRLLAADGSEITAFVDVFTVGAARLTELRTFTH